ncbi:hypothetical protein ABW20_dc0108214 [Dactylellina cionopaga]|nr:hypothetical protein ABW20_dc0108214 [Dactylellina cionopaga]
MASNPELKTLTSTLITTCTGFPPTSQHHAAYLAYALKSFRFHKAPSTDPFAVKESLTGLEEKFRVTDNDTLADEFASRVHQLEQFKDPTGLNLKDEAAAEEGLVDNRLIPDILSLLLSLSHLPVLNAQDALSSLNSIVEAQEEAREAREKKLAEEEASAREVDNDDNGLWDIPDFASDSSSEGDDWVYDDEFTRQAEVKQRKRAARKREEKEDTIPEISSSSIDDYLRIAHASTVQSIELAQYWSTQTILPPTLAANFVSYGFTQQEISDLWSIGELHVIREVIFALYGLPSSLFKFQDDGSINVLTTYVLPTTSPGSLTDILDHFASKAVILQKLRTFSKHLERRCHLARSSPTTHDAIAPAQSFVEAVQSAVSTWELEVLVPTEEEYVHHNHAKEEETNNKKDTLISLLQLQQHLSHSLEKFTPLYEVILALERGLDEDNGLAEPAARVSYHLELLFRKTCEAESNGRLDIFVFLKELFLGCLRVYLRPIAKWMQVGELREADGLGAFFVHFADGDEDEEEEEDDDDEGGLAKLWRGKYVLDRDESGTIVAPSFIREYGRKIFVVGKSVLFLRKLGEEVVMEKVGGSGLEEALAGLVITDAKEAAIAAAAATGGWKNRSLVSFNDALLLAMAEWVDKTHKDVSARLRDILYYECGLWDSLEAVVDVYFMRDGFAVAGFCDTVFERMEEKREGRKAAWDDRFLLTELVQSVYSDNKGVEVGRLGVRSRRQEVDGMGSNGGGGGVKALGMLVVDYRLTWPIMNVFTPDTVEVWKKVWGFLLMIRRSRAVLERMRVGKGSVGGGEKVVYEIRWKLLTFVSLLQTFLVDLVIRPHVEALKMGLEGAVDIDEMIDVQEEVFGKIAELCLVSGRMAPLYQAVVSVMEVAVVVAESAKMGGKVVGVSAGRNVSFSGSMTWRGPRKSAVDSDEEEEDTDSEDESDDGDGDNDDEESDEDLEEKRRRRSVEKERGRREMLGKLSAQAHKLILFLTTGLRGMARAGVYPDTIEILAERLEMGVLIEDEEEE